MTSIPFGFVNVDKPSGLTSHDVVARIRRGLGVQKVGHAGTLDPLATGVLVVCLGAATRLSEYVMSSTKRYEARVRLGVTTDTYDAEGAVVTERDAGAVTRSDVEGALGGFTGPIEQLPPLYSAIKMGGRKLYELARAGETADVQPRPVTIHALELLDWQPPEFTLAVTCSAGTYVRSLAFDLGERLGVGAYLAGLIRTASGHFALSDAVPLDTLLAAPDWPKYVVPPLVALADWPRVALDATGVADIEHGRAPGSTDEADGALTLALRGDGSLLAVLVAADGVWKPHKVFLT